MPEILVKHNIFFARNLAIVAKHYKKRQKSGAMKIRQIFIST